MGSSLDDAVAVVNYGKGHSQIDENKIILLGHSEGCIIAPAVNEQVSVQGVILLAGVVEPLGETTAWQREEMKKDMRTAKGFEGWLLRLLKMDKKLDKMNEKLMDKVSNSTEDVVRYKGKKINAKWDREHRDFDVRNYLPKVTCPVLAITGTKDVQVKPEQVKDVSNLVAGECETHLIEDMTHILRKTDKEYRFGTILEDYKNQVKHPIDRELRDRVSHWLNNQFKL